MARCYTGCCDRPEYTPPCQYCECCLRGNFQQHSHLFKGFIRDAARPIWTEEGWDYELYLRKKVTHTGRFIPIYWEPGDTFTLAFYRKLSIYK